MASRRYPISADEPDDTVLIIQPDIKGAVGARDIKAQIAEIESLTRAIQLDHLQTLLLCMYLLFHNQGLIGMLTHHHL